MDDNISCNFVVVSKITQTFSTLYITMAFMKLLVNIKGDDDDDDVTVNDDTPPPSYHEVVK